MKCTRQFKPKISWGLNYNWNNVRFENCIVSDHPLIISLSRSPWLAVWKIADWVVIGQKRAKLDSASPYSWLVIHISMVHAWPPGNTCSSSLHVRVGVPHNECPCYSLQSPMWVGRKGYRRRWLGIAPVGLTWLKRTQFSRVSWTIVSQSLSLHVSGSINSSWIDTIALPGCRSAH